MAGTLQFINITNLTVDTTYTFVCYAGNVAGVGEQSDPAEFMTCKCVIVLYIVCVSITITHCKYLACNTNCYVLFFLIIVPAPSMISKLHAL